LEIAADATLSIRPGVRVVPDYSWAGFFEVYGRLLVSEADMQVTRIRAWSGSEVRIEDSLVSCPPGMISDLYLQDGATFRLIDSTLGTYGEIRLWCETYPNGLTVIESSDLSRAVFKKILTVPNIQISENVLSHARLNVLGTGTANLENNWWGSSPPIDIMSRVTRWGMADFDYDPWLTSYDLPTLSIEDVSVVEGDGGTTPMDFTVRLSEAPTRPVTAYAFTYEETATESVDYDKISAHQLKFWPGDPLTQTLRVNVATDDHFEGDESFRVVMKEPAGAVMPDPIAIGTIYDDDPITLAISDTSVLEGDAASVDAEFAVTLSEAFHLPVTVDYTTADDAAVAAEDYTATSGTLTIPAGQTDGTIVVPVLGDGDFESDETFFVDLSNANGAMLTSERAVGTILNDDFQYQIVFGADRTAPAGTEVRVPIQYDVSTGDRELNGLGLRIHFDSSKVSWVGMDVVPFDDSLMGVGSPQADTENHDGDGDTDQFVLVGWIDFDGAWPGPAVSLPAALGEARFAMSETLELGAETLIRFSASATSPGYILDGRAIRLTVPEHTLDISGDGSADALTDGMLIVRHLIGFSGQQLTGDIVPPESAAEVEQRLIAARDAGVWDIDDNGVLDALTDGIVIVRYLMGFTGQTLIDNVVDPNGGRTSPVEIQAYLQSLLPAPPPAPQAGSTPATDGVQAAEATVQPADGIGPYSSSGLTGQGRQIVTAVPDVTLVSPGDAVSVAVTYETADPVDETLAGLGLRLHYDSAQLQFNGLTAVLEDDFMAADVPQPDVTDADGNAETGTFVLVGWFSIAGNWPGEDSTPALLYEAEFTATEAFAGPTTVGFSASSLASGYALDARPATIESIDQYQLSIADASVTEGNDGGVELVFPVTLSGASDLPVSVAYETRNGSAVAGEDYVDTTGTLTIPTGQTSGTIIVPVIGDDVSEPEEALIVVLSGPTNAVIARAEATGTIHDDDPPVQQVIATPAAQFVRPGLAVSIAVDYGTAGVVDETLTGLGLRMHYDSTQLAFVGLEDVLDKDLLAQGTPEADTQDFDGNTATDRFVHVAWMDASAEWPGEGTTPAHLLTARFIIPDGLSETTWMTFSTSSAATGYSLEAQPVSLTKTFDGDATLDGKVNHLDYDTVLSQFGQTGSGLSADFNADGIVDFTDFAALRSRYGSSVLAPTLPAPAPETPTVALAAVAAPLPAAGAVVSLSTSRVTGKSQRDIDVDETPISPTASKPAVDLLVESPWCQGTDSYLPEPQTVAVGSLATTLYRAATVENDLRTLGDDLPTDNTGDVAGDGLQVSVDMEDSLDILAESPVAIPL